MWFGCTVVTRGVRFAVGNVLPGQAVDVLVSYVTELRVEGDALRLVLPVGIGPRYVNTPVGAWTAAEFEASGLAGRLPTDLLAYGCSRSAYYFTVNVEVRCWARVGSPLCWREVGVLIADVGHRSLLRQRSRRCGRRRMHH